MRSWRLKTSALILGKEDIGIVMTTKLSKDWMKHFRKIIVAYNENRAPDPFMIWFRHKDAEHFFENDFERVLAILIDARFDQRTTAEKALENTIAVVNCGALERLVMKNEIPLLTPRQNVTAEKWTDLFCDSLSKLHSLSAKSSRKKMGRLGASWCDEE